MSDPSVSVVIAWVNPLELLLPGLDSLARQERSPEEVIVVTRHDAMTLERLRGLRPDVNVIPAPNRTPITKLRSIGIRQARGSVIAVTEDHCLPGRDWIARIARTMGNGVAVTGGSVENACTGRARDWAAFLTEYSGAVRPLDANVSNSLPGNNVAYRGDLVSGVCQTLESGLWESFYNESLAKTGAQMSFDRDLIVYHRRPFDFWYFAGLRYHFCRSFAGMRRPSLNNLARWKYGLGSLFLPPILLVRAFRNLTARKRFVGRFLACSPLIAFYFVVGAVGEMIGYLFGSGSSLEKVE